MSNALDKLFDPKTIAVIGASAKHGTVGNILVRNLVRAEPCGIIYPINRTSPSVHGLQAYATVSQVPRKIDLAIIAVPAPTVPDLIRECGEAGVAACVVVSSGFREAGGQGEHLEHAMLAAAREFGIRLLGPNCLGFIRPHRNLNASFAPLQPQPGRLAFISQSGALGVAILDWAATNSVGFSAFVSVGSMCDVDFGDLIDYFGADPRTNSIILYLESLPDARKFMGAARHFAKTKPIIVVKSGRNARSAAAAAAHSGVDAGDDTLYSAAFRRAGVVRVYEVDSLFAASEALSRVPRPPGPRLGIVTNAGGPAVMAVDRLLQLGGQMADLSAATDTTLAASLPSFAARANPVDVGDDAEPERFAAATRALLSDDGCDGVLAIIAPHAMGNTTYMAAALTPLAAEFSTKPLLASLLGDTLVGDALQRLRGAHIPAFHTPEDAVAAYMYMHEYAKSLAQLYETPADILPHFDPDRDRVKQIFAHVAREGRSRLTEVEAKQVLAAYGIPVIATFAATSADECARRAQEAGLPVAIKILSPDVIDKAAVQGIGLDVRSVNEAGRQFGKITDRVRGALPEANLMGVTVHAMSRRGVDIAVDSWRDATFGPALRLRRRGFPPERSQRASVEFPPLNQALAHSMVAEARIAELPARSQDGAPADTKALEDALVKFSYLLVDFPEIEQVVLDPFQLRPEGVEVLDATICISPGLARKITRPGSHLVISMYPSGYRQSFKLDGDAIEIRPIRPEDERLWADMIGSLSSEAIEYRFFGPVREITKAMLVRYCHIDYDAEMAVVAVRESQGESKMVGVASFALDAVGGESAEFAIVVCDEVQHKGVGTRLMNVLIEAARDKYIRVIEGHVLAANTPMMRFCESLGFDVEPSDDPAIRNVVLRL
jgi:acetyltransferase